MDYGPRLIHCLPSKGVCLIAKSWLLFPKLRAARENITEAVKGDTMTQ